MSEEQKEQENLAEGFTTESTENQKEESVLVNELEKELAQEKDQYLRLFAEFDNYKKRTQKERIDIFKTANKEVIVSMLPVLDDFNRGMKELEKNKSEELIKGISLIYNKMTDILRGKGLKQMDVEAGADFDTDLHEAITQIPAPTPELKGKVVDVVETGYLLNDVVIRYAKVVVGM